MRHQGNANAEEMPCGHREAVICKPRKEGSIEANLIDRLILNFRLQNCEKRNVCCVTIQSVEFGYDTPHTVTHMLFYLGAFSLGWRLVGILCLLPTEL